jgi:hypothetical protein
MSYSCWMITDADRERLLAAIPPIFPDVIAHHVTIQNPSKIEPLPAKITVVGQTIDPTGVQVLLVKVTQAGRNVLRSDDVPFHITWSIDRAAGKKPFSSVEVLTRIGDLGMEAMDYSIETTPAVC